MYLPGRFALSLTRASLAKRIGQNEKLKRQLQRHNEANVDAKAKADVDAMLWQKQTTANRTIPSNTLSHTHAHTLTQQSTIVILLRTYKHTSIHTHMQTESEHSFCD